jgi:glycosyltransferase involved in cell wall biosynthesis
VASPLGAPYMKILMVSEDLPGVQLGGLGKHVVTLSNALLAQGHDVAILGRRNGNPGACGFHGRFIGAIELAHPNWKESHLGFFNPVKRPWFARTLAATIARHAGGYDAVHYHGHLPLAGNYIARACPFVQTRHDQGSDCLIHLRFHDGNVCNALDARTCAGCIARAPGPVREVLSGAAVDGYRDRTAAAFARHKTVFVSEFLRRRFQQARRGADLRRTCVIPNVVDMARLQEAAAGSSPALGRVVLAGRIDTGKGFAEFLAAAQGRLPAGAQVHIVGDGPAHAALAQRYAGPGIAFAGWQDYASTIAAMARAQLCIVPSVCEEACSTTVLEALALGRPCLALARGGTPELARFQRYPGQLVLCQTIDDLVDAIAPLLAAPAKASDISAPFGADVQQVLPRLLELYAE